MNFKVKVENYLIIPKASLIIGTLVSITIVFIDLLSIQITRLIDQSQLDVDLRAKAIPLLIALSLATPESRIRLDLSIIISKNIKLKSTSATFPVRCEDLSLMNVIRTIPGVVCATAFSANILAIYYRYLGLKFYDV